MAEISQLERVARTICAADGLNWDELCGFESDQDECDSGTCVAALCEDHDPDWSRTMYRQHAQAAIAAMQMTVPGVLKCAKCDFRLVKTTLTSAGAFANEEPDTCPNCAVPMWRVSWEDEAKDAYKTAESQMDRALEAERKLAAMLARVDELARYATHNVGCRIYNSWASGEPECNCGRDAAFQSAHD